MDMPANKPNAVGIAVNLIWASFAVGVVKSFLDMEKLKSAAPVTFTAIVIGLTLAILALINFKILAGKNWARITFLILFLLGFIPAAPIIFEQLNSSPVVGGLSLIQAGLQAYAAYLLFSRPGSGWFQKPEPV